MYGVWEDIKAVVEEKDKKQYNECKDAELDGSADLLRPSAWIHVVSTFDIRSYVSSLAKLEDSGAGQLIFLTFRSSVVMGELHMLSQQGTQLGASIESLEA